MANQNSWKTEFKPSAKVLAGSTGVWTLDIYPAEDLSVGDVISFNPDFLRARWDIGEFFFTTAADCHIEHRLIYPFLSNPGASNISFMEAKITEGHVNAGELIRLYMGNYSQCGRDFTAPTLAVENASADLLFRPDGKKEFQAVSKIFYDIVPAETSRLSAHLMSPASEMSDICVSSIDSFGNVTSCCEKLVLFAIDSSGTKHKLKSVNLDNGKARIDNCRMPRLDYPAWLYAELENDENINSEKVPFYPGFMKNNGRNIYFGEMHLHSAGSTNDGMNSPEYVYNYAQYVAGMAFCCITDHVGKIRDDFWAHQRKIAKEYYNPGSFVPILGYEWDSNSKRGHTCVFVKGDLREIIKGDSIEEIWRKLDAEGYEFFTKPNHVNTVAEHLPLLPLSKLEAWKNYDWSQHNDKYQPLVEMVNPRGSSEKEGKGDGVLREGHGSSVESALAKGCHIGFCGGSDDHTGHPGAIPEKCWIIPEENLRTGLTAVLAEKADMDSVWNALINRNTYATTGAKMLLDFRVNGLIMGNKKSVENIDTTKLYIHVIGTDIIENISIICNAKTIKSYKPESLEYKTEYEHEKPSLSMPCNDGSRHLYYYIRITQQNGHRAWTSPIYLCYKN